FENAAPVHGDIFSQWRLAARVRTDGFASMRKEPGGLMKRCVCALALFLPAVLPVAAQETRGAILGHALDPTGAFIAGVEVRATNVQTGVSTTARTNESGSFVLSYLIPGRYTVQAEMAGFKKSVLDNIEVRINDRVEVNITLQVGDTRELVEVRDETPLLETATSSLGQVVD